MGTTNRNLALIFLLSGFLLSACSPSPSGNVTEKAAPAEQTATEVKPARPDDSAPPARPPARQGPKRVTSKPPSPGPPEPPVPTAAPAVSASVVPPPDETADAVPAPQPAAPAPPPPIHVVDTRDVTIPAGTEIAVRMIDSVDSGAAHEGGTFRGALDSAVLLDNQIVLPKGSDVYLKVTHVTSAGDLKGKSELQLSLDRIFIGKKSYAVESNSYESSGAAQGQRAVRNGVIGAAIGAAIGAITGGRRGAVIGAGAGAGGGVGGTVLTGGEQVLIPSEARLVFALTNSVEVTVPPPNTSLSSARPDFSSRPARLEPPPERWPGRVP